ncbi:MAG: tRNA uridine(34) 5-carboxymethylaminomethyl modification radical SAM/GNAT enzyme Elp3, partial [Confluentibacter sp.]|nr:tRNA uridine(34) 5-carboxymethylaminomethyl modification radical SAM/GNAT enzyme Elp3 [Confluentibacter sp.]
MKKFEFDYSKYKKEIIAILKEASEVDTLTWNKFRKILAKYPKDGNQMFSKNQLVLGYEGLIKENHPDVPKDEALLAKIQMKPVRTQSGVTTVTVLTKPFPCPGKCIFCPNDIRMPKSYLADEPGAQRAHRNKFDPYLQTYNRLLALKNIGHNTQKIELIVLGGTWSYYPEAYQIWFIKNCFEAMNDFGEGVDKREEKLANTINLDINQNDYSDETVRTQTYNKTIAKIISGSKDKSLQRSTWDELFYEHKRNETSNCRNVGLVVETRPDNISIEEITRIRKLGCTKTQIGFQSLNDSVLKANNRGHNVDATRNAVRMLRQAGFKIHAHWMANLYGSTLEDDISDYKKMFTDDDFKPDELKIYPCSLIESAELFEYYQKGLWQPYNFEQMHKLLTETISLTPPYCRLTRVVREFSADVIVEGNTTSNFRQIAEKSLDERGITREDIRSREIRKQKVSRSDLTLNIYDYTTTVSSEKFIQFVTNENKIAGFLRLSLPKKTTGLIEELNDSAIIREIHVYGNAVNLGEKKKGKAQHLGLGTELINKAVEITKNEGYKKLAVISAIGTRE